MNINLSLPKVIKVKPRQHFQFSLNTRLKSKQYHAIVLLKRCHLNGHTITFCSRIQKLKPPFGTPSFTVRLKGFILCTEFSPGMSLKFAWAGDGQRSMPMILRAKKGTVNRLITLSTQFSQFILEFGQNAREIIPYFHSSPFDFTY